MNEMQRRMQELLLLLPPGHQPDEFAVSNAEELVSALEGSFPLPRNFLCTLEDILEKSGETRSLEQPHAGV